MTLKRRLLLLGVFANALVLITVAIGAIATRDPHADRGALMVLAAAAMVLVPLDIVLGWVLCDAPGVDGEHRSRASV